MEDLIWSGKKSEVKVKNFNNLSDFSISHPQVPNRSTLNDYSKVLRKVIHNGRYNTRLHQLKEGTIKVIKIFQNQAYRAKILKVYCPVKNGKLVPGVETLGLDTGTKWCVSIDRVFEFPPLIRHWALLEPMVVQCCFYDIQKLNHHDELDLTHYIKSVYSQNKSIKVEMRDFIDGRLFLDVIKPTSKSSSHLNGRNGKVQKMVVQIDNQDQRVESLSHNDWEDFIVSCFGYMHNIHQNISRECKGSYPSLRKSLLGVEIMWWDGPDLFYVRPVDSAYREFCRRYQDFIDSSMSGKNGLCEDLDDHIYHVNEFCLMRNEANTKFGRWLRGRIEMVIETQVGGRVRTMDKRNADDKSLEESLEAMSLYGQCINAIEEPRLEGIVYKVRSIDYGFVCLRTKYTMRPLSDTLRKVGSLSMRCSLFGIHPTGMCKTDLTDRVWTASALSVVDQWMYTRRSKKLYIIIREDQERRAYLSYPSVNPLHTESVGINLFCLRILGVKGMLETNESERFESLSSELINLGLATDYCDATKISSRIFIDEELLNTTESAGCVPIDQHLSTGFKRALQNFGSVR